MHLHTFSLLVLVALVRATKYIVVLNENLNFVQENDHFDRLDAILSSFAPGTKPQRIHKFGNFHGYTLDIPESLVSPISQLDGVKYVEKDQTGRIEAPFEAEVITQNSPPSWGISRVSAREKWQKGDPYFYQKNHSGKGSTVYVIDTGVFANHSDFEGRAELSVNFVTAEVAADLHGHGTHVSGTAISSSYGVAKDAKVKGIKVCTKFGSCETSDIIAGVEYAVKDSSQNQYVKGIISMSLGLPPSRALDDAANAAVKAGVAFVCSAGNGYGRDACDESPRRAELTFAVASSTNEDRQSPFSNIGKCVDIFAPGSSITSLSIRAGQISTVMSGIMAILASQENFDTVDELYEKTRSVATKGVLSGLGYKTVNLLAFSDFSEMY
ncbi:MAG: hypothetical protein SGCHY_003281 [Lobulomycetales sp.]